MNEVITLNHGSGGKLTNMLIREMFASRFGMSEPLTDSSVLKIEERSLAFTTDSYVVDPLFFPGGDIGKLAVCGTVNDLAVSGSVPLYLSASFIIEEGLPVDDLKKIAESMAKEAEKAGVKIVTGDTKVVEKGKCDKLFITTSGVGKIRQGLGHISTGSTIEYGDKLIVNGSLGNHALAVLGARNDLGFSLPLVSDCASLNHLIAGAMKYSRGIRFMRDLTRGGLAAVLNELAGMINMGISVNESAIPVDDPVRGLCEMLGFDPLYLANEGKLLIVTGSSEARDVLKALRSHPLSKNSDIIGEVVPDNRNLVILNTMVGGKRILDMPSGNQLPRIC